ncbi:MAG: flagellar M-ring protein FliF [Microvirga sp.]|nr:flagellar M-ring protein FliF [Microvirga sp.]
MSAREHADKLWASLLELGPKRLMILAIVGLTVFLTIGLGAFYLSRPQHATLYTGLERDDVTRIGSALTDAGIPFDVNAAGNAVMTPHSQTARARMLLAEKGLPYSSNAGYELFDNLGSLGITSFMQEVTRVRALEGEIARSVQAMRGVRAARVHIVMADPGSFRREQRPPSASVVVRMDTADTASSAQAIRHLVAAAVPGMSVDRVTVLSTDGSLLASGEEGENAATGRLATLNASVNRDIESNIRRTLTPYLGLDNFEVSAKATINTDRRVTNETIFDPESRVERSIRIVRENEASQNLSNETPTTVQQNIPREQVGATPGEQSSEEIQRREELTNFEISSRQIQTSSDGYLVENVSIALLVNRARVAETLGPEAGPAEIAAQIAEIEQLAASAGGLRAERGDTIKVSVVDFLADNGQFEPVPGPSVTDILLRQSGAIVSAISMLLVAAMLVWFGLRPAIAALVQRPTAEQPAIVATMDDEDAEFAVPSGPRLAGAGAAGSGVDLIADVSSRHNNSTVRRLEQIVQLDEDHAVHVLKQWMHAGEAA